MKTKLILLFVIISITLSACSSGNKIDIISKNLINEDLSDDISINKCLYNEESNAVYVKFYSFKHGNDEAIIFYLMIIPFFIVVFIQRLKKMTTIKL